MSPCARCALRQEPKDNDVCRECNARYRYAMTLERDIDPPEVDLALVRFSFIDCGQGSPARGTKGRYCTSKPTVPRGVCAWPGCDEMRKPRGKYCEKHYQFVWRRKHDGIPVEMTTAEARAIGQKRANETKRRKGLIAPHAGHIGFV